MKRQHWPNFINRQGTHFESKEIFAKHSTVVDSKNLSVAATGIPMTLLKNNTFACTNNEFHSFIIGESGCGKTRRVILTAIRLLAKAGESMVIADPKGEIFKNTAGVLKKKGYNVKAINFRTPSRSDRWNPLALIEEYYRSDNKDLNDKSTSMLKDIFTTLQAEIKSEKDPYWENSARDYMTGISQLLLEYGPEGCLTFENIMLLANELYEKASPCNTGSQLLKSDVIKKIDELPNSTITKNLSSIIHSEAKSTSSCVFNVFQGMISPFTSQESILELFNKNDFDIDEIGTSKTALFLVLPDDSPAFYSVATVLINQIYSTLINLADSQPNGILPNRVTFLLDEFANFTQIPSIDSMLTAARSRGMRFALVCQSMEQLNKKYGDDGTEIILSNCRNWIYMSCRNYEFLKRLENLSGIYTSPYTKESIPLVSISDLQHFEMGKVLIFNDRCYPYIGNLPDYSQIDFGDEPVTALELPAEKLSGKRITCKFFEIMKNKSLTEKRLEKAKKASIENAYTTGDTTLQKKIDSILNGVYFDPTDGWE